MGIFPSALQVSVHFIYVNSYPIPSPPPQLGLLVVSGLRRLANFNLSIGLLRTILFNNMADENGCQGDEKVVRRFFLYLLSQKLWSPYFGSPQSKYIEIFGPPEQKCLKYFVPLQIFLATSFARIQRRVQIFQLKYSIPCLYYILALSCCIQLTTTLSIYRKVTSVILYKVSNYTSGKLVFTTE